MKKVLILASGGLDSSTLIALYSSLRYEVHLVYFDYGNKNAPMEKAHVLRLMEKYTIDASNCEIVNINIPWSNSSCIKGDNGDSDYVEMRNLIFLANAISLAQAKGIEEIAYGAIYLPDPYPDASEDFVERLDQLAMSTTGAHVVAPLINMTKANIWALGSKLGLNLSDIYSCNHPDSKGEPCGKCIDCKILEGLSEDNKI